MSTITVETFQNELLEVKIMELKQEILEESADELWLGWNVTRIQS